MAPASGTTELCCKAKGATLWAGGKPQGPEACA